MKRLIYILIFLSIAIAACDEYDSDIDIPPAESKLVLSTFLSPRDTETYIFLYRTIPTIGSKEQDPVVKNATIILSDGTFYDTILFNPLVENYSTKRIIESNKTYTVKAILDDEIVEASCTVLPEVALDFTYTIDSVISNDLVKFIVRMEWKDSTLLIPQTYYRTDVELQYFVIDTMFISAAQNLKAKTPKTVKGTGYNTTMSIVYESTFIPRNTIKFMDLHLFMVDQDYYKFELSEKGSLGFISYDPVTIYSNVRGGLGIVASYNNYVLKNLFLQ